VGGGAGGGGSIIAAGTVTTTLAGRMQLIMGLPKLEVVAEDPPNPTPLEIGTVDVDPPVMVPVLVPTPEPAFRKLEPLHPVLVVTVRPIGTTAAAPPPTRAVAGPPPTGIGGCTRVATPPTKGAKAVTPSGGSKSPETTGEGSALAGCGWNSGAGSSVASPKGSNPKNAVKGALAGCGWKEIRRNNEQGARRYRS
jgi:hypothetical protein